MTLNFLISWGLGYAMTKGVDAFLEKDLQIKLNQAIVDWAKQYEEEAFVNPKILFSGNSSFSDAPNYEKIKSLLIAKDNNILDGELWCGAFMEQWHYVRKQYLSEPTDMQPFFNLPEHKVKIAFEELSANIIKICRQDDAIFKDRSLVNQEVIKDAIDELKNNQEIKQSFLEKLYGYDDGSQEAINAIKEVNVNNNLDPAITFLRNLPKTGILSDGEKEQELQKVINAGIFYECTKKIDTLIGNKTPTSSNLGELLQLISTDNDIAVYFYRENTNPAWLDILNNAGQFTQLGEAEITNDYLVRMKALYLVEVAKSRPNEVVALIARLDVKDFFIQGILLEALLAKPLEVVKEGMGLLRTYLNNPTIVHWYSQGDRAAKFMVAIAEKFPDEAFELAGLLLEIHKSDDKNYFDKIKSKFKGHDYDNLLLKYYKILWQIYPLRATQLLIDILNSYLNELGDDDFELESGFHITIERIDQVEEKCYKRIIKSVIQGICEFGKDLIEQNIENVGTLFSYFDEFGSPIFDRIKMYLLRFVPEDGQIDQVNAMVGDKKYLSDDYEYEYRLLLRDRFENISDDAKKIFIDFVEEKQVSDDDLDNFANWFKEKRGRDHTAEDLTKYEDFQRAGKLYLLREKGEYKELYEKYKGSSGKSDEELEPKIRISEAQWLSGKEGTPLDEDKMLDMEPIAVIEYICNPSNLEQDKTGEWSHRDPKEALSQVFESVVKKRVDDYVSLELSQLQRLKPVFLQRYYNGIVNVFRENNLKEDSILIILEESRSIVEGNIKSTAHNWTFRLILEIIETVFNRDDLKKSIVPENSQLIWHIIDMLRRYKDDRESDRKSDAHSESINSVSGQAFALVVRFGLFFKNFNEEEYAQKWSGKIKGNIKDVVDNVEERWVRCILGVNFPQIHWLETELVEQTIDKIFNTADDKMWKDVWGSYLSWSRAYKNVFLFLKNRGKYTHAISSIDTSVEKKSLGRGIDEGLVQHLMIAYFNDWIEWGDPLLERFFEKASAELHGKAVDFLKTGFSSIHEEGDVDRTREKGERVKHYWEKRLEAIDSNPKDNFKEVIEFVGWVKDTLIEPTTTLELTFKTLELTGGKLGGNRDEVDLVKGVCKIGVGDELLALKCMTKMMQGRPEWLHFSIYSEELKGFLGHVVGLDDEYDEIKEIRNEAIELANAYGRRQINDLKPYYEQLIRVEGKKRRRR